MQNEHHLRGSAALSIIIYTPHFTTVSILRILKFFFVKYLLEQLERNGKKLKRELKYEEISHFTCSQLLFIFVASLYGGFERYI